MIPRAKSLEVSQLSRVMGNKRWESKAGNSTSAKANVLFGHPWISCFFGGFDWWFGEVVSVSCSSVVCEILLDLNPVKAVDSKICVCRMFRIVCNIFRGSFYKVQRCQTLSDDLHNLSLWRRERRRKHLHPGDAANLGPWALEYWFGLKSSYFQVQNMVDGQNLAPPAIVKRTLWFTGRLWLFAIWTAAGICQLTVLYRYERIYIYIYAYLGVYISTLLYSPNTRRLYDTEHSNEKSPFIHDFIKVALFYNLCKRLLCNWYFRSTFCS